MTKIFTCAVVILLLSAAFSSSQAQTTSISVAFGNEQAVNGPAGVTDSIVWNNLRDGSGSSSDVLDQSGAASGVTVNWASESTWGGGPAGLNEDQLLLKPFIGDDNPSQEEPGDGIEVTVADIPLSTYDLVVYFNVGSDIVPDNNLSAPPVGQSGVFDIDVNGINHVTTGIFDFGQIDSGNSIVVRGLSGPLTLSSPHRDISEGFTGISNLAGFEIVDEIPFALNLQVNRDTGEVILSNATGAEVDLSGLGLFSQHDSWDPSQWISVENALSSPDEWLPVSADESELSELTLGSATIADGQSVSLGTGLWLPSFEPTPGVSLRYLDANTDESLEASVEYIGDSYNFADLDFDRDIDADDWALQRDNFMANMSGLTVRDAYILGDLDGDFDNDVDDLNLFRTALLASNPSLATSLFGVPEPASAGLILAVMGCLTLARRRLPSGSAILSLLLLALFAGARSATADSVSVAFGNETAVTGPAGVVGSSSWNNLRDGRGASGVVDQDGVDSGAVVTWASDGTWGGGPAGVDEDGLLLKPFIKDGQDLVAGGAGIEVTVDFIPAPTYDVTLYFNIGSDIIPDDDFGALPVGEVGIFDMDVNGVNYTTTGAFNFGQIDSGNSITVTGLSGPLTLSSGPRPDLTGGVFAGISNLSGFEIVADEFDPTQTVLTLRVDPVTGNVELRNDTPGLDIPLEYYEITSDPGVLNTAGWAPLDGGRNDFQSWEVLGENSDLSDTVLAQYNISGPVTMLAGESLFLGAAYGLSQGEQPLSFRYRDPLTGGLREANIEFGAVDAPEGLPGDFNSDGIVDAADYTVWRDNLNEAEGGLLSGNGDGNGVVDAGDYSLWRSNYGQSASLPASATNVPEPAGLCLLAAAVASGLFARRRELTRTLSRNTELSNMMRLLLGLAVLAGCSEALAVVTVERQYSFGGDSFENASQGAVIGSDNEEMLSGTLDGIGPDGGFIDAEVSGAPIYVNVSGSGLNRPGAGTGQDGFGAQFDGVDDFLAAVPLNRPEDLQDRLPAPFPDVYTGLTTRGMQMWVYPSQAGLDAGVFQSIAIDTNQAGGPAIDEQGMWTQIHDNHGVEFATLQGSVPVVGDTWHHVMHHIFRAFDPGAPTFPSAVTDIRGSSAVVYVNGIAVSANNDDTESDLGDLVIGANETSRDGDSVTYANYFNGVVDDFELYVNGNNTSQGGQDYGAFDLFEDNAWIKSQIDSDPTLQGNLTPGDANFDGQVSGDGSGPEASDDVARFVANWGRTKELQGSNSVLYAGDWETWGWGDFNHDGVVEFADWAILRRNHASGPGLSLGALLQAASVPEPASASLALMIGWLAARRRCRDSLTAKAVQG